MENYFYRVNIHFRDGRVLSEIRRFFTNKDINGIVTESAIDEYGKENVARVDTWYLLDANPEVIEYKKKWL